MSARQKRASSHVLLTERSVLDVFVPKDADVDLSTLLAGDPPSASDSEDASLVSLALQRDILFLDEKIDVCLLLKCPFIEEESFRKFISRVNISLETVAVGTNKAEHGNQEPQQPVPLKDLVDSKTLESTEDPLVAVGEEDSDDEGARPVYVLWKTSVHIVRSRIRSSNPSVFFAATLTLKPRSGSSSPEDSDEYMQSGVPESTNLLASFASDPAFRDSPPHLSAARLEKVAPASLSTAETAKPLRNGNRRLIRLVPALNTRVRFSRVGASPSQAKVLASIDIEISPLVAKLILENAEGALSEGHADSVLPPEVLSLPKVVAGRDIVSLIYNLLPNTRLLTTPPPAETSIHTFSMTFSATVTHQDRSMPLQVQWRTAVDLTSLTRFPLISLSGSTSAPTKDSTLRAAGLKTTQQKLTLRNLTLTLKVSSPPKVDLGETLVWTLLVANRSKRTLRLAAIPLMIGGSTAATALPGTGQGALSAAQNIKSQVANAKGHRHKSTLSTSLFTRPGSASGPGNTNARPTSQSQQRTSVSSASGPAPLTNHLPLQPNIHEDEQPTLLPLTADVRIPPLAPGECAEAELQFLTLRPGVGGVEVLRVVDLDAVERQTAHEMSDHTDDASQVNGEEDPAKTWTDVPRGMLPDVIVWDGEWRDAQTQASL